MPFRQPLAIAVALFGIGCGGLDARDPGATEGAPRPTAVHEARVARALGGETPTRQILFGDLHVHSSYSWDGFLFALPMVGGDGTHPPSDACDFARYCADLDFFALTDHAESLSRETWAATRESIRECNALGGEAGDPDVVAFTGFEWSQAGLTPETHWGHRCVLFPDDEDEALPPRPIGAHDRNDRYAGLADTLSLLRWLQPTHWRTYDDAKRHALWLAGHPPCAANAPPDADCREIAASPADLHARLDAWGLEAISIPHGTTWGIYTPATSDLRKQLDAAHYRPDREPLIEIMSGHGNSEEYRDIAALSRSEDGAAVCEAPSEGYLPCCWQAGEIMRSRCGDLPEAECERRVRLARELASQSWTAPFQVFPDSEPADWLDCDQCRDCFKPAFNYRPRESVQYAMSLRHESQPGADGQPLRFRYGFTASSDNHTSRPGTGYKQVERGMMTDVVGQPSELLTGLMRYASRMEDARMPQPPAREAVGVSGNDLRSTSFLYPGGLSAVHAEGRSREAIWSALKRREVYGTSGPRILLWFDLLNGPEGRVPMGGIVSMAATPRFEVRAVGDFVQQPGCPVWTERGLAPERREWLCRDECYHPGDARHPIERIEVVRIRVEEPGGPDAAPEIEDPWRTFACEPDPEGCRVRFEDPEAAGARRDFVYYVRALQEPTLAINGDPLTPERDDRGRTLRTRPCLGRGTEDGCPAPVRERAWSSPVFVDRPR